MLFEGAAPLELEPVLTLPGQTAGHVRYRVG